MQKPSHYLFLDESGDHGLTSINENSSIFLLCGVLFHSEAYDSFSNELDTIKTNFWNSTQVVFHSRDIRKCNKEFAILLDYNVKAKFYESLNNCIQKGTYTAFATAIRKDEYIRRFGKLSNDVYELSLSFIIERAIFRLDELPTMGKKMAIILEQRGKKEDLKLREHFQRLKARGTGFVSSTRLNEYGLTIHFRSKSQNVNGLQLADLLAYPCATKARDPQRPNPAFEIFEDKIYAKGRKYYGFKVYP